MRLLIDCVFKDGEQTLIMDPAGEADFRVLVNAMETGDPEDVLIVRCRVTPDGPIRDRLVAHKCVRAIRRDGT